MSYQQISSTRPRARKEHGCVWCPEKIAKGEQHLHLVGKYFGDLQDDRFHEECHTAACEYWSEDGGDGEFDPHAHKRGSLEEA